MENENKKPNLREIVAESRLDRKPQTEVRGDPHVGVSVQVETRDSVKMDIQKKDEDDATKSND